MLLVWQRRSCLPLNFSLGCDLSWLFRGKGRNIDVKGFNFPWGQATAAAVSHGTAHEFHILYSDLSGSFRKPFRGMSPCRDEGLEGFGAWIRMRSFKAPWEAVRRLASVILFLIQARPSSFLVGEILVVLGEPGAILILFEHFRKPSKPFIRH